MQNNLWKYLLIGFFGLVLVIGAFGGGFITGQFIPVFNNHSPLTNPTITDDYSSTDTSVTPADLDTLFQPFWETWDIVNEQFVDQPVDQTAMMRGAIRGMLESLGDQHTSYMDPDA